MYLIATCKLIPERHSCLRFNGSGAGRLISGMEKCSFFKRKRDNQAENTQQQDLFLEIMLPEKFHVSVNCLVTVKDRVIIRGNHKEL
jgi:hypothetical protein